MTDTPTPGQIAYEAWRTVLGESWLPRFDAIWGVLTPVEKRAWEAAARAVLAWQGQEEEHSDAQD